MAYFFHTTGKLGQSYLMETEDKNPVFEARCMHVGILRPNLFQLVCFATGAEREITVSHTVTIRKGLNVDDQGDLFRGIVAKSSFKIDGTDAWELLREKGLSLETSLEGLALNFNVYQGNERIIRLDAYSPGPVPQPGHFRVTCEKDFAEDAFLVCFIVSRVEFF